MSARPAWAGSPTVLLISTGLVVGGGGAAAAAQFPRWPSDAGWGRYVQAPSTAVVVPIRVVRTSGEVDRPGRSTQSGGVGVISLTMVDGGPRPRIVVDYGKDVGGVPYFVVRSETGHPDLHASFSEGLQYLGPDGDGGQSMSSVGDLARADTLALSAPGHDTTGFIQGGERYEEISLTSVGTVTLSSVGIKFTAVRATPGDFRGWFDSSSDLLNRIWYDGAYTTQLDQLPAGTLPAAWRVVDGALTADGGNVGTLRTGSDWRDYNLSFRLQIQKGEAGWLVRSTSPTSGYLFFLDDSSDTEGAPNTLQEIVFGPSEYTSVADIPLPGPIRADSWHQVRTDAAGPHITTSIDGRQVASLDTDSLPPGASVYDAGTVGFMVPATQARFRDLTITAPDGHLLYANTLSRPSSLDAFSGPEITTPDPLPVVMDGAKRDRVVWSGDLGVAGPTVFDTTGTDGYIRESLRLLGSYQSANGESGADVPPTVPLGTFPESGYPYSTSYSMDEVVNIATYYLYTGDLAFVRSEWPMITRELGYNRSLVNQRGLMATDSTNGADWDYYDGDKTAEVTAYNDIYYQTLSDAATMAQALGLEAEAAQYLQEAASLRSAINRYLFDSSTDLYPVSDLQPGSVAQDGNALAVVAGVVPNGAGAKVLDALQHSLPSTPYGPLPFSADTGYRAAISPFVTNEELQALFAVGDTSSAMALLETVWGHMDTAGPDFTAADWEGVGANGRPDYAGFTSLAHGWSTGATADLTSDVLGVQPTSAGYRTWSLHPHPGVLAWVEGDVPTPRGPIAVRWAQARATQRFALEVERACRHQRDHVGHRAAHGGDGDGIGLARQREDRAGARHDDESGYHDCGPRAARRQDLPGPRGT